MDRTEGSRNKLEGKREAKGVMELGRGRNKDRWKHERDEGWKDKENDKQEKERDGQKDRRKGRDKWNDGWAERKINGKREGKKDGHQDNRSKEEETRT